MVGAESVLPPTATARVGARPSRTCGPTPSCAGPRPPRRSNVRARCSGEDRFYDALMRVYDSRSPVADGATTGGGMSGVPKRELLGRADRGHRLRAARWTRWSDDRRPRPGYVCAMAVHSLMVARHDAAMRAALLGASMWCPTESPLVWALNLLGEQLPDRVYGPDLTDRYCARCERLGSPGLAVRRRHAGGAGRARPGAESPLSRLEIAGGWSPPAPSADRRRRSATWPADRRRPARTSCGSARRRRSRSSGWRGCARG